MSSPMSMRLRQRGHTLRYRALNGALRSESARPWPRVLGASRKSLMAAFRRARSELDSLLIRDLPNWRADRPRSCRSCRAVGARGYSPNWRSDWYTPTSSSSPVCAGVSPNLSFFIGYLPSLLPLLGFFFPSVWEGHTWVDHRGPPGLWLLV